MFKIKKAQGLSMNVIIVAVLALLVLVILSVVFTSKMRSTRQNIDSCDTASGVCVINDPTIYNDPELEGYPNYCGGTYDKISTQYECPTNKVCCIRG